MAYKQKEKEERKGYNLMARDFMGFFRPVLEIRTNLNWPPERFWRIAQGLGGKRIVAVG